MSDHVEGIEGVGVKGTEMRGKAVARRCLAKVPFCLHCSGDFCHCEDLVLTCSPPSPSSFSALSAPPSAPRTVSSPP